MSVVPLSSIRAFLNISSTNDDDELIDTVDRAEAILARRVGPLTAAAVVNEAHVGPGPLLLRRWPVVSVDSVTMGGVAVAGWAADLEAGVVRAPYVPCGASVQVSYTTGRAVPLPADLEAALLELTKHLWESQRVPMSGGRPGFGGADLDPEVGVASRYLLPYRVQTLIEPYLLPPLA